VSHELRFFSTRILAFKTFYVLCATAGQEDPFELASSLLLSSGRHGEDRKRQYFLYNHETPLLGDLADLLYSGIAFTVLFKNTIHIFSFFFFYFFFFLFFFFFLKKKFIQ